MRTRYGLAMDALLLSTRPKPPGVRIRVVRMFAATAGSLCLFAGVAVAQDHPSFDPLGLPVLPTPLMCQNFPADTAEARVGLAVTIVMTHGEPGVFIRNIAAGYDSAGRPLALQVAAERKTQDDTSYIFAVRFGPDSSVHGTRAVATNMLGDGSAAADSAAGEPRILVPPSAISEEEGKQARHLALWVWDRRCKGQPPVKKSQ
ncbi:MAG: hypothetical protein WKF55_05595 [Gemmatimonadaceae bacterium]